MEGLLSKRPSLSTSGVYLECHLRGCTCIYFSVHLSLINLDLYLFLYVVIVFFSKLGSKE